MVKLISVEELARWKTTGTPFQLLDVRQPEENAAAALPESKLIPLNELVLRVREIEQEEGVPLVVYCHHGVRSHHAANWLSANGFDPVYSLTGGIDAWSLRVDPNLPRY